MHPARRIGRNLGNGSRMLIAIQIVIVVIGFMVSVDDIEASLVFGFLGTVMGLVMMTLGGLQHRLSLLLFGAWIPALTFLCFWTIVMSGRSPRGAESIILPATFMSAFIALPIGLHAFMSRDGLAPKQAKLPGNLPRIRLD